MTLWGEKMRKSIGLGDFIKKVKEELVAAQDNSDKGFYELREVELEVSFGVDAEGGAKGTLFVVELGTHVKSTALQKVKLKLVPVVKGKEDSREDLDEDSPSFRIVLGDDFPRYFPSPEKRIWGRLSPIIKE